MIKNLVLDLDDTIIHCGIYYDECRKKFVNATKHRTGLPERLINDVLLSIDKSSATLPDGFDKERFPRSFEAASVALDVIAGLAVDTDAGEDAYYIGASVFHSDFELIEGSYKTLQLYKNAGFEMFLLTKGPDDVQQRKIDKHRLTDIFSPDHIYIDIYKTKDHFERILTDHQLNKNETVMIGDSLKDDIKSAYEAGVRGIFIRDPNRVMSWDTDTIVVPSYDVIKSITELPNLIPLNTLVSVG
jgi:putative hydrolase of the HAD superfamily